MAINAVAAEAEDFTVTGVWVYSTNSSLSSYRSGYQRGALYQTTPGLGARLACKPFASAKTTQGFTARFGAGEWANATEPLLVVTDGGSDLFGVFTTVTTGLLKLLRWNGSSWDTLATGAQPVGSQIRLDMYVENYGASGRIRVWLTYTSGVAPATLWLDSGTVDITTSGSTDFDGAYCGVFDSTTLSTDRRSVSEFIAADEPTLRMSVVTIYPNAAGDTNTMDSGTYASIDELAADTGDFVESGTAGQYILVNCTTLPTGVSLTPLAVQVTALAAKGVSGPTKMQIGIKSGSESWSTDYTLDIPYAGYSRLMNTNPATGNAWQISEIPTLQIGVKSVT